MSKITEIKSDAIIFDDGYVMTSDHCSDCCEHHWLDFSNLATCNIGTVTGKSINIYEQEFDFSNGINFRKVEGVGILLYDTEGNKYLINGYGKNNGYYGTDIDLVLYKGRMLKYEYDVSECQEIDWG